jgi:oligoendopeptidase F
LFDDKMPIAVYDSLIAAVHSAFPSFHHYLAVRQRTLKLDALNMWDLYVPLVASVDAKVPYDQAVEWVLESLKPLGEEYVAVAREGVLGKGRWVDVMESKQKRSGACSIMNFGGKQYMMLIYDDSIDSAFTLAHELGHSMHSHYSCVTQPFRYAGHSISVAEIASTLNEALLFDFLYKKAEKEGNRAMLVYLINKRCDDFKGTILRQVQFAEFEKELHAMAERGEPLTPDSMSKLYKRINDVYYGDSACYPPGVAAAGSYAPAASTEPAAPFPHVLRADPRIGYEFMRIPHFYSPFYVYKYATCMSVAEAIAPQIIAGDKEALAKYYTLLRVCPALVLCPRQTPLLSSPSFPLFQAGRSKDPLDIIAGAGVDMRTPQPFIDALKIFDELVCQLDTLLKEGAV